VAAPTVLAVPPERGAVTARGSDFADLLRRVKTAGLLQRRPGYYLTKIAVTGVLFAAGWAGFVLVGDSWWQIAVAAFLAVVFGQIGSSATMPGTARSSGRSGPTTLSGWCTATWPSG
jgi:hypothetical protein